MCFEYCTNLFSSIHIFEAARRYFGHVAGSLGWETHKLAPLSFRGATYSGVFTLLPLLTGTGRAHHSEIMREATLLAKADKLVPLLDPRHFMLASAMKPHEAVKDRSARQADRRHW
jgi:NADPH:quinone reductase